MDTDDLKALVQFLKKENVAHFKCSDFELVFHPTAFVPDLSGPVQAAEKITDEELLYASSN
jgi:hypothetical protein